MSPLEGSRGRVDQAHLGRLEGLVGENCRRADAVVLVLKEQDKLITDLRIELGSIKTRLGVWATLFGVGGSLVPMIIQWLLTRKPS